MIRAAAVAGQFYPGDPKRLRRRVAEWLGPAAEVAPGPVLALIVPHAGYDYSGPIAASAYALLRSVPTGAIRRVVILGTAHRKALDRPASSSAEGFATPLGTVPVDRSAVDRAVSLGLATIDDEAHRQDHAIEVQLPFLQMTLGPVAIVPFLIGRVDRSRVVDLIAGLTADDPDGSLIVVSSDLSHYRDSASAERLDRETARAIVELAADLLRPEQACGRDAIAGLLDWARIQGWKAELLDLRNSGDTAGPRDRVVGYGAFAFRA